MGDRTLTVSIPLWPQDLDTLSAELAGLHAGLVFARLEALHDALAAQGLFPGRSRLRHLDRVLHRPDYSDFLAPFKTHS